MTSTASSLPPPAPIGRLVLLGHPVAHSLSPRFQRAALAAAGVALDYEARDVAAGGLSAALGTLRRDAGAGNVTVPHKARVAKRCAVLSDLAARAGAVNTFWHDADRRLIGDNTDVGGFDASVRAVFDPRCAGDVALIGAGGSASAVLAAVARWPGARVRVWSRRFERAAALAARAPRAAAAVADVRDALAGAALVVNATPLGMHDDDPLPVSIRDLPPAAAVFDLVYAPARTRWVRAARAAGHAAEDGLAMLVEQGALAFARWFGREPDRAAMWAALGDVTSARRDAGSRAP